MGCLVLANIEHRGGQLMSVVSADVTGEPVDQLIGCLLSKGAVEELAVKRAREASLAVVRLGDEPVDDPRPQGEVKKERGLPDRDRGGSGLLLLALGGAVGHGAGEEGEGEHADGEADEDHGTEDCELRGG